IFPAAHQKVGRAKFTQALTILLLTATPHSGDPSQFAHFLRLLDADQFPDPRYDGLQLDRSIMEDSREGGRDQWFLRRIKEELRDRDGNPLFTKRHARTVPFELTWAEKRLYDHVTQYINRLLPYQRSEEHTSELQSRGHLVCRLLLEKKKLVTSAT